MRRLALRELRMKHYYPQILLRSGLAIFGLLLVGSAVSGFVQGSSDVMTFYLTHVMAFLSLVVGIVLFIVGAFLARRTYQAMKTNADADIQKARGEVATWRR